MKCLNLLKLTVLSLLFCMLSGCGPVPDTQLTSSQKTSDVAEKTYCPVGVEIMPLTEIVKSGKTSKIKAYICLLDKYDSQIKYPGVFRFELYQKVQYSGQPKGKRLHLWPDFNLTEAAYNNKFWQDTFRAYKFELDIQIQPGISYVLQTTCILPNGRRLTSEIGL